MPVETGKNNYDNEIDDGHPSSLNLFFTIKSPSERFSRFENMVEAFLVYGAIFFFTWKQLYGNSNVWDSLIINIIIVYTFLGAYIHKNSSIDIGIAHVKEFKENVTNWKNKEVILTIIILIVISVFVLLLFNDYFVDIMRMVPLLGPLNGWVATQAPGATFILQIVEYIIFQVILIVVLIRKDNIYDAFKDMAKPFVILVIIVMGYGLISAFISLFTTGEFLFVHRPDLNFLAIWYSYTFSGVLQQIPFLVYFSTRFRKGLPAHRYSEWLNVILISVFFGFFHGQQWVLVFIAGSLEFVLARSFLHDESRNLFAAAIVHGLIGALIIFFTPIAVKLEFAAVIE